VFYSPINSANITNNIYDITRRDAARNFQAVEPTRVNPLSTIEDMSFTQSVNCKLDHQRPATEPDAVQRL